MTPQTMPQTMPLCFRSTKNDDHTNSTTSLPGFLPDHHHQTLRSNPPSTIPDPMPPLRHGDPLQTHETRIADRHPTVPATRAVGCATPATHRPVEFSVETTNHGGSAACLLMTAPAKASHAATRPVLPAMAYR